MFAKALINPNSEKAEPKISGIGFANARMTN